MSDWSSYVGSSELVPGEGGDADARPVAVIDIGSNSVRLVVYEGSGRAPLPIFNEKVLCGLARGMAVSGRLSEDGMALALDSPRRLAALIRAMGVRRVDAVATAAVRDTANGDRKSTRRNSSHSCGHGRTAS